MSTTQIAGLIATEEWQAAIDAVVVEYQIDAAFVNGTVTYDPTLAEEGMTSEDRRVRIGRAAFRPVAWLASTVAHEVEVHVNRHAMAGRWYTGSSAAGGRGL